MLHFVFDIDGTICFNGKTIDNNIIEAIEKLINHGISVIFASARPIRDMLPVLPNVFHYCDMIGGNGSFYRNSNMISANHISEETEEKLRYIIHNYQIPYLIDGDWDYSFNGSTDSVIYQQLDSDKLAHNVSLSEVGPWTKAVLFTVSQDVLDVLDQYHVDYDLHRDEGMINISANKTNKYTRLHEVIGDDNYVAFGNDINDTELFRHAQISVCVGEKDVNYTTDIRCKPSEVASTIETLYEIH